MSETRDRLIETARRLFHEQGYHATGVATILREAGVRSGSLYHFFDGKEGLLLAVLDRYVELLEPLVLAPVEAATEDGVERVFALLRWYREGLVAANYGKGCPLGNLALEIADDHPRARELVDRNFTAWAAGVHRWLEAARDAGRLPGSTDLGALSRFALTVMEGGFMQARVARSIDPYDEGVAVLRAHFELLTRAASGEPR